MNASDREFIRELLSGQDQRLQKQLEQIQEQFQEQFKEMQHSMDLMVDHFDSKFSILVEGQQALAERMDRVIEKYDGEVGRLDNRLVRVEAELLINKTDPDAHPGKNRFEQG